MLPYSPESPPVYSDSGDGDDDSDESVVVNDEAFEEDDKIFLPFSRATVGDSSMDDDDDDDVGTATLTNIRRRSEQIAKGDGSVPEVARQERIRDNTRRHPSEASSTATTKQGGGLVPAFGNPVSHRNRPPGSGGHGAESSPSMGSSFSDLSGMWTKRAAMLHESDIRI